MTARPTSDQVRQQDEAVKKLRAVGVTLPGKQTCWTVACAIARAAGIKPIRGAEYDLIGRLLRGELQLCQQGAPIGEPAVPGLIRETGRPLRWEPPMRYVAARARAAEPVLRSLASSVARTRVWEV